MNKLWSLILLCFVQNASAGSTFVGNGGSILDSDLNTTLDQIRDAAEAIPDQANICTCKSNSEQCTVIKSLSLAEQSYCASYVRSTRKDLLSLLKKGGPLRFQFSDQKILMPKNNRKFDAGVKSANMTVVIDEDRFIRFTTAERIQLITHELLHLIPVQDQAMTDDRSLGPFKGPEAGRRLLDAAGASYAIAASRESEINLDYISYSRPARDLFLELAFGSISRSRQEQQAALFEDSASISTFSLTWYPRITNQLGWSIKSIQEYGESRHYKGAAVKSSIEGNVISLGPSYRWLTQTGYTYLDSIQYKAFAGIHAGSIQHVLEDEYTRLKGQSRRYGINGALEIHLPLPSNLWVTLTSSALFSPYKIESLNIKDRSIHLYNSLGVAYGWLF